MAAFAFDAKNIGWSNESSCFCRHEASLFCGTRKRHSPCLGGKNHGEFIRLFWMIVNVLHDDAIKLPCCHVFRRASCGCGQQLDAVSNPHNVAATEPLHPRSSVGGIELCKKVISTATDIDWLSLRLLRIPHDGDQ